MCSSSTSTNRRRPPATSGSTPKTSRLQQGCEVAGAIGRFNAAQENLEKSTQSLEQTFATGAAGLRALQTRLAYEAESQSLQYAQHLAELRQGVVDESRRNELADTQFEIEKARKAAELAQVREAARGAAVLAERKAAALAADASTDQLRKEIELENARRAMNEVRGRRRESEFDGDAGDDNDPPAFRAAMAREEKRREITRARDRKLKAILDKVGGDESKLTEEEIETMEAIKEASARAERAFDLEEAGGAIFPEEESQ